MSTIKYLDNTGLQYTLNKLKAKLATIYVAQEAGKGLSANDLTNELLAKLNSVATGATKTEYDGVYTSGTKVGTITINDTDIEIYVPQSSSITIDDEMSDSSTNPVQNKVIKAYVDEAVEDITGVEFRVVSSLPATGEAGVIYLVPKSPTQTQNIYTEYIWLTASSTYEKIGDTSIDLSGYVQFTDLVELSNSDIDTIFTAVFGS